jgi:GT2 family glycosyltransferase
MSSHGRPCSRIPSSNFASHLIGVVVVQYGCSILSSMLLEELTSPLVAKVVVVRNPARKADIEAPSPVPVADLIVLPENLGYSAAVNVGRVRLRQNGLGTHVILTHDVEPRPGFFAELTSVFSSHPGLSIVGPLLLVDDGNSIWVGGTRSPIGRVRQTVEDLNKTLRRPSDSVRLVQWIDGAAMALRPDVGELDERFFLYGEDVALCMSKPGGVGVALAAQAAQRSGKTKRPGAHGYLVVRNALLLKMAEGGRGYVAGLLLSTFSILKQVGRVAFGPHKERVDAAKQAVGMCWGVVHACLRRSGPPPSRLRDWGDIRLLGDNR